MFLLSNVPFALLFFGNKLDLKEVARLNLYYKISMVAGVVLGLLLEKFKKISELRILVIHSILFLICHTLLIIGNIFDFGYVFALIVSMAIGIVYSHNTSCARGLLGECLFSNN